MAKGFLTDVVRCFGTVALCVALSASAQGATLVLGDGDFNPIWSALDLQGGVGGGTVLSTPTGTGNPPDGTYLQIDITSGAGGANVESLAFGSALGFDPSGLGAILGIGFEGDLFRSGGARAGFGLVQNGTVYYHGPSVTNLTGWSSQQVTGLLAASFVRSTVVSGTGGATPDFSASGAPITFGVYSQIAGFFVPNAGTAAVDDFQVTVDFTPVP